MKTKMVPLFVGLLLLSALAVVIAQTSGVAIGPYGNLKIGPYGNLKIGPYGNLVGLTDSQGKDVISQPPLREGYAIAYRVKNPNGGHEERLVYAIGDQLSRGLTSQGRRSTNASKYVITQDKRLEINRTITWDAKAKALKSDIAITNIGTTDVEVVWMETQVDERLLGVLLAENDIKTLHRLLAMPIWCRYVRSIEGDECNDCPGCPCGGHCGKGQALGIFRYQNSTLDGDPLASVIAPFDGAVFSLIWNGANLADTTLGPKERSIMSFEFRP